MSKLLLFSILLGFIQMVFAIAPFAITPAQAVTSTYSDPTAVNYFTVPESVYSITITLLGAGGGIGGTDGYGPGTAGYIGKITGTISVRPGDTITIAVGGGGVNAGGTSTSCLANIGQGSQRGRNPLVGSAGGNLAYNGGDGGAPGPSGCSGGGGGGGAATVLHISGHGYYIAAGGGGSGGGNNVNKIDPTIQAAYPNGVAGENRSQTNNSTNLYGATPNQPGSGVDGGGSGGGGGGYRGGIATDPAKTTCASNCTNSYFTYVTGTSGEVYGYGASAGSNYVSNSTDNGLLTTSFVAPAALSTSGCHNTTTGWVNYGCGADGSVTLSYAPTATLTQKDANTATVSSTEVGTVYLVNETVSVTNLASITSLPSSLMVAATISTANTSYDVSLSGLSPGTYVAYAYGSSSSLLSGATRTTVAAGGMCTLTTAPGLTYSYSYRLGYCFVTFMGGSGTWNVPSNVTNVSFLAVGGGGGGGENGGSGGGGGALQDIPYYVVTSGGTVSVTVGAGGAGGSTTGVSSAAGSSGGASIFGSYTANGGGGGNSTGGSGGVGGTGGTGGTSNGGAGSVGSTAVGVNPGTAGTGAASLIRGTSATFAGGGAGGDWQYGIGTPGTGGGWSGIELQQVAAYNNAPAATGGTGVANTGGGGGGGAGTYGYGGTGGSGVVIVRYIATTYKPSAPASPTIYPGDTTTFTTTAPNLFGGITRTIKWQVSYDTGTTWTNVDTGTLGLTSTYTTPSETNTSLTYWFRAQITDTTTTYSFITTSDTATIYFQLKPSNDTDTALYFNGSQIMKTLPKIYNDSAGGSIEVWVKPDVGSCASANKSTILYKANTFQIYCQSGLWYGFTSATGGTAYPIAFANMPVRTGEWTHLALTYDGTIIRGYYNGQATEYQTNNNSSANIATPWLVGGTGTANEYFSGQIDELKIWSNQVVDTQVTIDMDTYTVPTSNNLVAYYDFNEGTGNAVYNRDYPYDGGSSDLYPYLGSSSYTWYTIESSSVSGNYKTTQFPRTIITAKGGWKIPKQVNTSQAFLVAGGGGGGENAGQGGAGGGGLSGVAATRSTNTALRVKVGAGGNPSLPTNLALTYASLNYAQNGMSTVVATPDLTTNGVVNGGSKGLQYSVDIPCSSGGTPITTASAGGAPLYTTGFKSFTSLTGGGGAAPPQASGSNGQNGGTGYTNSTFNGTHLFGGGGGSGAWSSSKTGGLGGGDNNSPKGGNGNPVATAGESGIANTGNGGGGAGNTACTIAGGQGGSGVVYLKYLTLDTVTVTGPNNDTATVGAKYTFKISATLPNAALNRSYQWQFSSDTGTTWANLITGSGYDSNTYTTATLDSSTSGAQYQYHCLVIDSDTNGISIFATSNNAYLTMAGAPTINGAANISATYGTSASSSYTPINGVSTRKFSLVPGSYGGFLDPTFNSIGYETVTIGGSSSSAQAIAFDTASAIYLGGWVQISGFYNAFAVTKFDKNGVLDNTFGTNGSAITSFGTATSFITSLYIDPATGNILAGGQTTVNGGLGTFALARYLPNGSLDSTFGIGGSETITVPNAQAAGSTIGRITMQSDGKILIAGTRIGASGTAETATVLRLTSAGALDNTWGSGGFANLPWGAGVNTLSDIMVQSDGKILVAGQDQDTNTSGPVKFAASRLTSTGSLDASYGTSGSVFLAPSCSSNCQVVSNARIAPDYSIYLIGNNSVPTYTTNSTHITPTGTLDTTWGSGGFLTDTSTGYCAYVSIGITSLNQVVTMCQTSPSDSTTLILYDTSGARVASFGNNGTYTVPTPSGINVKSLYGNLPFNNYFAIDSSNGFLVAAALNNNTYLTRVAGNNLGIATPTPFINLDTSTFEVGKVLVDTFTAAGNYLQTLYVTDTNTVTGYKTLVVSVSKAPGVTITAQSPGSNYSYTGDTLTVFDTVTTSGLVAGDSITVSYKFKAPSTDTLTAVKVTGDTYTVVPVKADTFTITPLVTAINHGSVTGGVLSNYLSTTYVNGTLKLARGTRTGFAINSSSGYAYAYVGAPLQLSIINARDTGTIVFTVSGANCALDTNTLLLSDTATTSATCIVSATIARTANWETATTQTTFYFQSYVNYYPSPADGSGPTIALSGQVAITIVAGAPTITAARVSGYDSTTIVTFLIQGTGFGTDSSVVRVKIARKAGTITSISDTALTVTFPVPPYGDNVNWGRLSVSTPVAMALVAQDYISGQSWSYNWVTI